MCENDNVVTPIECINLQKLPQYSLQQNSKINQKQKANMRSADRYSSNNDIDDIFNDVDNCDNHMERKHHLNDYSNKNPGGSSE